MRFLLPERAADDPLPRQNRLAWLCHGRRQEELKSELANASSAEDALTLQQLIDDSLRSGISAREMQPARLLRRNKLTCVTKAVSFCLCKTIALCPLEIHQLGANLGNMYGRVSMRKSLLKVCTLLWSVIYDVSSVDFSSPLLFKHQLSEVCDCKSWSKETTTKGS